VWRGCIREILLPEHLREPPVHDPHVTERADEHVVVLQLPVHDAERVRMRRGLARAVQEIDRAVEAAPRSLELGEHLVEAAPLHLLHGVPPAPVRHEPEVVHRDEPRVVQGGGELGLGAKPSHRRRVRRVRRQDDLERHRPVEDTVPHAPHLSHSAAAQQRDALVARREEELVRGRGRRRGRRGDRGRAVRGEPRLEITRVRHGEPR
jgi:hypothetical protein